MQTDLNPKLENALGKLRSAATSRAIGRVANINVRKTGINGDATLILSGTSKTYYGKQLAQHGLLELFDQKDRQLFTDLGISHFPRIDNQIVVS